VCSAHGGSRRREGEGGSWTYWKDHAAVPVMAAAALPVDTATRQKSGAPLGSLSCSVERCISVETAPKVLEA
jgi:hypothetical protein